MGKITSLEPQKKTLRLRSGQGPKRVNLFVDGKFVVGLDLETALKEKLEIGKEITPQDLKYLTEISGRQKILDKVFRFLSFRPRSQKEIRDYLIRKKTDEEEAEDIIEQLKKTNYINDEEFARWWLGQRITFQPKGWRVLKMELRQKGVPNEVIDSIKSSAFVETSADGREPENMEFEAAKRVVEKKLKVLKSLPEKELKQKLSAALARRGFEWEVIKEVIRKILRD